MSDEKRTDTRASVLKRAKITFGNPDQTHSVIDCVVMNTSSSGIKARTTVPANIPEWVTLVFPDGPSHRARRRWTRGTEVGFELTLQDTESLLDAMIAGLTPEQRRSLVARIEASLVPRDAAG
jgi:hypothetical protein